MKSKLGLMIEQLTAYLEADKPLDEEEFLNLVSELQKLQSDVMSDLHESFDLFDLTRHGRVIIKIAAANIMSIAMTKVPTSLASAMSLIPLADNAQIQLLTTFAMKQALILFLAEQKAHRLASGVLAQPWVVAEPEPEDPPSSDQTAQPPAEPPEAS